MAGSSTGKSGQRKHGRGLRFPAHARYVNENRRERNKVRKIKKHLKAHENDKIAAKALKNI